MTLYNSPPPSLAIIIIMNYLCGMSKSSHSSTLFTFFVAATISCTSVNNCGVHITQEPVSSESYESTKYYTFCQVCQSGMHGQVVLVRHWDHQVHLPQDAVPVSS